LILLQLRYRRAWISSIWLLVLVIVVASLAPARTMLGVDHLDKLGHFAAYFTLTLLGAGIVARAAVPRVIVWAILLGLAMEAAQALFTDTRTADWADALANTTGVLTAWWLVRRRAGWALAAEAWLAGLRRH
jgi:VanZ family protein